MVFFLFGSSPGTWALGNTAWTAQKGLPCGHLFIDGTLAGNTVSWGSVGPGGLYCFCLEYGGAIICTANGALLADTKPSPKPWGPPVNNVEHLSFSPLGGWFTSYKDGTVRLSGAGAFPESFHQLAAPYLQTRNNQSPQTSSIRNVFFGENQAVIIKLANGVALWANLSEALATRIRDMCEQGWTVGRNTSLCQWGNEGYYMVEFVRWYQYREISEYYYHVPNSGMLSPLLVREVLEGGVPVSHTAPREHVNTMQEYRKSPAARYPPLYPLPTATGNSKDPQPRPNSLPLASKNPYRTSTVATTNAPGAPVQTRPPTGSVGEMSEDEYRTYKYLFLATDKAGRGYISGEQMLRLFESSGLGKDELANIWVRSDTDMNGRLDMKEFCTAMYLIGQKRKNRAG